MRELVSCGTCLKAMFVGNPQQAQFYEVCPKCGVSFENCVLVQNTTTQEYFVVNKKTLEPI